MEFICYELSCHYDLFKCMHKIVSQYWSATAQYASTNSIERFRSPSALRGHLLQAAIVWGHAGCPLSGVEKCPLLRGSKCTISIGRAIRGMGFVRCTEVVHFLESPLLEVSL